MNLLEIDPDSAYIGGGIGVIIGILAGYTIRLFLSRKAAQEQEAVIAKQVKLGNDELAAKMNKKMEDLEKKVDESVSKVQDGIGEIEFYLAGRQKPRTTRDPNQPQQNQPHTPPDPKPAQP